MSTYDDIVFPFELPPWIDEKFLKDDNVFHNFTYRRILSIFFNTKRNLYHIVEYKKNDRVEKYKNVLILLTGRTTYLIALIELIDRDEKMKYILKQFLKYTRDINFFHPTDEINSFNALKKKIKNKTKHLDVIDLLLKRKELNSPIIICSLAECIQEYQTIVTILNMFQIWEYPRELFSRLLFNYVQYNVKLSKWLIKILIDNSKLNYDQMIDLFIHQPDRPEILDFIHLIDWKNLNNFNYLHLCFNIKGLFLIEKYYIKNAHGLLVIYNSIVREYNIQIEIPKSVIQNILLKYREPEQIILLECTNNFENYKYMLPKDLPVNQYLSKRLKRRYGKFIEYWKHKTYCPGSKFHKRLLLKYSTIMTKNYSN